MVHNVEYTGHVSAGSMKYLIVVLAVTISHLVSAAALDDEKFQTNPKEALLTPSLRYRRFRILQVEDAPTLKDALSQQGNREENGSLIHNDKHFWGRLLQSDGSMSMSIPSAPSPVTKPTTSPVIVAPSPPPLLITSAPTTCSSFNRSDTVLSLLEGITPGLANVSSSSPQGLALKWILDTDVVDPCVDPNSIQQRYALATLFHSTSGESWFNSTGWLSMESECSWYGVSCGFTPDVERFGLCTSAYYEVPILLNPSSF
jgi:hypothetical protein